MNIIKNSEANSEHQPIPLLSSSSSLLVERNLSINFAEINAIKSYVPIAGCVLDHIVGCKDLTCLEKLFYINADALSIITANQGGKRAVALPAEQWAKRLNCSKSQIFSLQKSLVEKGYFQITKDKNKYGQNNRNIIFPNLPAYVYQTLDSSSPNIFNIKGAEPFDYCATYRARLDKVKLFIKLNFQLLKAITSNCDLSSLQKIIWLGFYSKCYKYHKKAGNHDQFSFTASYNELSAQYGASISTISKSINYLEKKDFLKKEQFFSKKEQSFNSRHDNSLWKFTLTAPIYLQKELANTPNRIVNESDEAENEYNTETETSNGKEVKDTIQLKILYRSANNVLNQKQNSSFAADNKSKISNIDIIDENSTNPISCTDPDLAKSGLLLNKENKINYIKDKDIKIEGGNLIFNENILLSESYKNSFFNKNKLNSSLNIVPVLEIKVVSTYTENLNKIINFNPVKDYKFKRSSIDESNNKLPLEVEFLNDSTKSLSISSSTDTQEINILKSLKDYYPLSQGVASALNRKAGREFSTNFTNQLLKKLVYKYPNKTFENIYYFYAYMVKTLSYEKHIAALVNHESFRFISSESEKELMMKERYLAEIESYTDTTQTTHLKKKIAARFETNLAYSLVTECQFEIEQQYEIEEGDEYQGQFEEKSTDVDEDKEKTSKALFEVMVVKLSNRVELTNYQKKLLENEIQAIYADRSRSNFKNPSGNINIVFKQKKKREWVDYSKVAKAQKPEQDYSQIWQNIRKKLKDYFGNQWKENDNSWFSKLEAEINKESGNVVLKAPSKFIRDWVKGKFLKFLEDSCQALNLQLDRYDPIVVDE